MIRIALAIGATVAALVPATVGLVGNGTFSQNVPVRIPGTAQVLPADDSTPGPSASASPEAGDDHGGDRPRDSRTEPGDDRDSRSPSASAGHDAGDDHGGDRSRSGSDDRRGSDDRSGSDDSGRGSDDSGSDDHGGSGHGSDD